MNNEEAENQYCETCKTYTMEERGTIYFCPTCENWHYSSS